MEKLNLQGDVKEIDINKIFPDPNQPRQEFDEKKLKLLADSISSQGIMNPIITQKEGGKIIIIDGERRYRASKKLGLKKVLIKLLHKSLAEGEKNIIRFQLQETHSQWSVFEKAEAIASLREGLDITIKELAKAISMSSAYVNRYLSILNFKAKERKKLTDAKIPFSYIEQMSSLQNIMPNKVLKECPDYIDDIVKKYLGGYLRAFLDLRVINKLIRNGEYSLVKKFFNNEKVTANQVLYESKTLIQCKFESTQYRAKALIKDILVLKNNNVKVDEVTLAILDNLKQEINSL